MKQFLLAVAVVCSLTAGAQAKDTALNAYVGKYSFPEGSFVTTAEVLLNDTVLSVSSSQGGSVLEQRGKDTFAMKDYEGGMMYFFRNAAGKVARVKVEVGDVLLEGTKDGVTTAWLNRNYLMEDRKKKQAR